MGWWDKVIETVTEPFEELGQWGERTFMPESAKEVLGDIPVLNDIISRGWLGLPMQQLTQEGKDYAMTQPDRSFYQGLAAPAAVLAAIFGPQALAAMGAGGAGTTGTGITGASGGGGIGGWLSSLFGGGGQQGGGMGGGNWLSNLFGGGATGMPSGVNPADWARLGPEVQQRMLQTYGSGSGGNILQQLGGNLFGGGGQQQGGNFLQNIPFLGSLFGGNPSLEIPGFGPGGMFGGSTGTGGNVGNLLNSLFGGGQQGGGMGGGMGGGFGGGGFGGGQGGGILSPALLTALSALTRPDKPTRPNAPQFQLPAWAQQLPEEALALIRAQGGQQLQEPKEFGMASQTLQNLLQSKPDQFQFPMANIQQALAAQQGLQFQDWQKQMRPTAAQGGYLDSTYFGNMMGDYLKGQQAQTYGTTADLLTQQAQQNLALQQWLPQFQASLAGQLGGLGGQRLGVSEYNLQQPYKQAGALSGMFGQGSDLASQLYQSQQLPFGIEMAGYQDILGRRGQSMENIGDIWSNYLMPQTNLSKLFSGWGNMGMGR